MISAPRRKESKIVFKFIVVVFCFILNGCGTLQLSLRPHVGPDNSTTKSSVVELESCYCEERAVPCEECKIVPQSGVLRDQRSGYYYDPKEKKCKRVFYSSGGVSAPFKTMEECKSCCCKILFNF
jgi:hypothetical protein